MNKLAYKFLYEPRVSELQRCIKESQAELRELTDAVVLEAKHLQDTTEQKQNMEVELDALKKQKINLNTAIENLQAEYGMANQAVQTEIEKRSFFIANASTQNRKERQQIEDSRIDFRKEIETVRNQLENEFKKRIAENEAVRNELRKETVMLEEKLMGLKQKIAELEQETQASQNILIDETTKQTQFLEQYRKQSTQEIQTLVVRKESIIAKTRTLENQLRTETLIRTEVIQTELNNSAQKLTEIEKQYADAVNHKQKLENEIATIHQALRTEVQKKEALIQSIKSAYQNELITLEARKAQLKNKNLQLEQDVQYSAQLLEAEQVKQEEMVVSLKREQKQEQERLQVIKQTLEQLINQITELKPVAKELQNFVLRELKAREKYLTEQTKLNKAEQRYVVITKDITKQQAMIAEEKQAVDGMKDYAKDLYGRLASYVRVAKETIAYVNEELVKHNAPLRFSPPPDNLLIVDMYNFDKERH